MTRSSRWLLGIIIVIAAIGIFLAVTYLSRPAPAPSGGGNEPVVAAPQQLFVSAAHGLRLGYPEDYFVREKEVGTPQLPQHAIVFAADTPDNRALIEGTATIPGEEPTMLMVDIYQNPDRLPAEEWAAQTTTWKLSDQMLTPVTIGGEQGISYVWQGLYIGRTAIVTHGDRAYVFTVTWIADTDRILADYDALLRSVRFE